MSGFEFREEHGGWLVCMDGVAHSWVDLDDPRHLEFGYMVRMADILDAWRPEGERMRVVHVGGGGMTMARYVAETRPTSAQIVLEPNSDLTQAVRDELPLPRHSGIKVRPLDGRSGIAAMRDDFAEVIIVDAFADARVPAELVSVEFFTEASRVLHRGGLFLMNIIDTHPFGWARRVMAGLGDVFSHALLVAETGTLKGRRHGNIVAAASDADLPIDYLVRRTAGSAFPHRVVHDTGLDRFVAGAVAFTDANATASPVVERGTLRFE